MSKLAGTQLDPNARSLSLITYQSASADLLHILAIVVSCGESYIPRERFKLTVVRTDRFDKSSIIMSDSLWDEF